MVYKCPNCDAALTYNPSLHMMECESCASFYEPEQVSWQSAGVSEEYEIKENDIRIDCGFFGVFVNRPCILDC